MNKRENNGESTPAKRAKTDDKIVALKRAKELRKREKKKAPKMKVSKVGEKTLLTVSAKERESLQLEDVRKMLGRFLLGNDRPETAPNWCHFEKIQNISQNVVVLVVDGLTLGHFSTNREAFPATREIFLSRFDTLMPIYKSDRVIEELLMAPLNQDQLETFTKKHGSLEKALEVENFLVKEESQTADVRKEVDDKFSRLKLLLSPLQMLDANFPLPLKTTSSSSAKSYVLTKDNYAPVTPDSPMFAMDCEMVQTTFGFNEVVRISIVNESCESVYETFVRPQRQVIDYRTEFSGVTAEMIENCTKTLRHVQEDIRKLLPADAILVGHSLNADLKALHMIHPYVIDTSVIYNPKGDKKRMKLKDLAKMFLEETIQWHPLGHDSIEDCISCMKLVKKKLSEGLHFGDLLMEQLQDTSGFDLEAFGGLSTTSGQGLVSGNLLGNILDKKPNSQISIIACDDTNISYEKFIPERLRTSERVNICMKTTNKATISKACKFISNSTFTLTHLHIADGALEKDAIAKTLEDVDQWIVEMMKATVVHGLFLVIFGGSMESRSGLTFAEFRKVDTVDRGEIFE
ncbi:uncharacterized protein DMENIID0001_139290 [Sergentomyia squamirostris]